MHFKAQSLLLFIDCRTRRNHLIVLGHVSNETDCSAKTQYRKLETNIPRNGIARPQSQFPHSCVCARIIYSHDRSAYSAAGKYVCGPILGIYKLLTDTCMWKWGLRPVQLPEKEYKNGDFRCCVSTTKGLSFFLPYTSSFIDLVLEEDLLVHFLEG